ncbi:hypothetical protein ABIE27_001209 [Paenibacillus sp. 4624]
MDGSVAVRYLIGSFGSLVGWLVDTEVKLNSYSVIIFVGTPCALVTSLPPSIL